MADQVKYTQKLKGDKVLIIGGSAGLGYGAAEACVENGCTVIISSSNPDRVQKAISKLQSSYPSAKDRITGHVCNLGDSATLESNIAQLLKTIGPGIDHVIHTAGDSLAVKPLSEISMSFIQAAGLVRFFAPMFIGKYAPKYMTPGPKSSITLTTGGVAERPRPDWTVINAYATGLQGMVRGLALDLKPIRVNLVCPGAVDTELWDGMGVTGERKEGMMRSIGEGLPVGKVGTIEEVAESYIYLMRDRNTTGIQVETTGGHLIV